jgi:hypothetical protein
VVNDDLPEPGPRSEWVDLYVNEVSSNWPSDEVIRRKDREGKIIWEHHLPVKMMVRKQKKRE